MTVEQLLSQLRRPVFNHNMAMHRKDKASRRRQYKADKEILDIVLKFAADKEAQRKALDELTRLGEEIGYQ